MSAFEQKTAKRKCHGTRVVSKAISCKTESITGEERPFKKCRLNGDSIPDPNEICRPDEYFLKLVKAMHGICLKSKRASELDGFFQLATEEQMAAYTTEVVTACRNNDLSAMREMQAKGQSLNCFNRFGESLLHMACRRGFTDIVEFLMEESQVSARIVDDCGRTPLTDACWNPQPQIEICQLIIRRDPTLFLIADKRGFTPFDYARPEHWNIWRQFLYENREHLTVLENDENVTRFL